jgi:Domain of unknown function (DUF4389)
VPYPVSFRADYVEKRSRLTTFFRLLLAIPHFIAVFFYFLAAEVVVIIAWFALLFTGRYPQGMYHFVAGALRYQTRVYGYAGLLADQYPPFSGDPATPYLVDLDIAPPKAQYSRLKVLFRIILAIPVLIIQYAMQIVAQVGSILAWFAIVILGRQPKGLQDMITLGMSYQQRATAYFALLTEDWPPFTDDSTARVEPAPAFGALPATPPAAGPESPTSVPPGGYASPEREAAFPSAPPPPPEPESEPEPPTPSEPASEAPTLVDRPPPPPPPAPEPPASEPPAPTAGDPLGGATPTPAPAPAPEPEPEPEPPTEPSPPSPGDWPDPQPESGPPSPGDWPEPEPEPGPPTPHADDEDGDEPPPGPFGPSSTNP